MNDQFLEEQSEAYGEFSTEVATAIHAVLLKHKDTVDYWKGLLIVAKIVGRGVAAFSDEQAQRDLFEMIAANMGQGFLDAQQDIAEKRRKH